MENLLLHHINATEKQFDELKEQLEKIQIKLDALYDFKITTMISARWVSLLISAACGILTLAATLTFEYIMRK